MQLESIISHPCRHARSRTQYTVDPCCVLSIMHLVALSILLTVLLWRSASLIRLRREHGVPTAAFFFVLVLTIMLIVKSV